MKVFVRSPAAQPQNNPVRLLRTSEPGGLEAQSSSLRVKPAFLTKKKTVIDNPAEESNGESQSPRC